MLMPSSKNYIDLGDLPQARTRADQCVAIARALQERQQAFARCAARTGGAAGAVGDALAARSLVSRQSSPIARASPAPRLLRPDPDNSRCSSILPPHSLLFFALLLANKVDEGFARRRKARHRAKLAVRDGGKRIVDSRTGGQPQTSTPCSRREGGTHNPSSLSGGHRRRPRLIEKDRGNATLRRSSPISSPNLADTAVQEFVQRRSLSALKRSIAVKRELTSRP